VRLCSSQAHCSCPIALVIVDRLLFATTNHIERIDPALRRPGRMDIWVNFTNATKMQAERIFKSFFPSAPPLSSPDEASSIGPSSKNSPESSNKVSIHGVPILEEAEIAQLAGRFADAIPEGEISVWPALTNPFCVLLPVKFAGCQPTRVFAQE
jgi:hypothetical protein